MIPYFPPRPARVHEVYGASALVFVRALWCILGTGLWIGQESSAFGLSICTANPKEQAWSMEEALRAGAVSLIVCARDKPFDFKAMRRLQLAAEAGGTTGLVVISERHASPVCETRWQCEPMFDPQGRALHKWALVKNKHGDQGEWEVVYDEKTHYVRLA